MKEALYELHEEADKKLIILERQTGHYIQVTDPKKTWIKLEKENTGFRGWTPLFFCS